MSPKFWKKIQRLAYGFYALIYIHIMVLFIPKAQNGREGYYLNVLVYSAVFIGYAVMRIRKAILSKKKTAARTAQNTVCACAMIVPLFMIGFVSRNSSEKAPKKIKSDSPIVFSFDAPKSLPFTSVATNSVSTDVLVTGTTTTATNDISSLTTTELIDEETEITEIITESSEAEFVITEVVTELDYRYKNGTFEGTGEGYAGTVHVAITIENDYITSISAYADDDDPEYFGDAMQHVIPQIQLNMTAEEIDACSGATYSSKGIIEAARNALEKACNDLY